MENFSNPTIAVITVSLAFVGLYFKIFTMVRDGVLHQSKFIPKYRYNFEYTVQNNYPLIIMKIIFEQGELPYYISKIYLLKYRFNCKIMYCKINQHLCHNLNNIHHIIQPISKKHSNEEVALEIAIPFKLKEKRQLNVAFGFDKYPYESTITIKLPPTDKVMMGQKSIPPKKSTSQNQRQLELKQE